MNVDVGVSFSILPAANGRVAYPFPKSFSLSGSQRELLDVASSNFFPEAFLNDLKTSDIFSLHIAIGIPESTVVPTLSYSDFFDLSETKTLSWRNIRSRITANMRSVPRLVTRWLADSSPFWREWVM